MIQLDELLAFAAAHSAVLGGSTGALLASALHARLDGSPRAQRVLAWLLPPFLNTKLAKAVAVDVAKAVLAAWDVPSEKPADPAQVVTQLAQAVAKDIGAATVIVNHIAPPPPAPLKDPSGNPITPTPGS